MAESCGLAAVALHARTREQGYSGQARWDWIAAVKDAVKIPVIGNGDIRTPPDACAMVTQTGCDAVMIGRMAPSNPWIFRQIEQYSSAISHGHAGTAAIGCPVERSLIPAAENDRQGESAGRETRDVRRAINAELWNAASAAESLPDSPHDEESPFGGEGPMPSAGNIHRFGDRHSHVYDHPTESDRYQMIRTYFEMLIEEELPDAIGKMKQFASWFTHGVPGGASLRKAIYESKSAPEVLRRVEDFFEARLCSVAGLSRES
jgi:tRNA-dihydrouridine synthase